ncbi:MAG TPA: NUDIX hydrolase [Pilimelia sp.]|nr:NUDIX hydrolase [Pilimelia sp.]
MAARARRFAARGGAPAPARTAATVALLRPAAAGFEVYVIRRLAAMAFGAVYAFPGGSVDPADAADDVRWAGPPPRAWADLLGLPVASARAVVSAAVREVFEETGVLLCGRAAGAVPDAVPGDVTGPVWDEARRAVADRRRGLAAVLADEALGGPGGLVLRSDLLAAWSRWITPDFEPRRFDTYFFVALLPDGQRARDVSGEADHTVWLTPREALALHAAGALPMLPPTAATLRELAAYPDPAAVFAAAAARDPATPHRPRAVLGADGAVTMVLDRR